MCELLSIIKLTEDVLPTLEALLREAEEVAPPENWAATRIQRLFRGAWARTKIAIKHASAGVIDRVYRGHYARLQCHAKARAIKQHRQLCAFNYFSLQLQKCFRGYYSRKYKQNQANRKEYIKNVILAGEDIRRSMSDYAKNQVEREMQDSIVKQEKEFRELSSNLHHLVSTKQVRGIYNPAVHLMEVPTVNDVPVEEYLRGAIKDLLKTKGLTKTGLVRDANGTLKVPFKGLQNRLSLQASAPYDMVEKEKRSQHLLHSLLMKDKDGPFFIGGKTDVLDKAKPTPLCVNDPYADAWSNPMMMRGVPENQKLMQTRALSRTTLPTFHAPPKKPFYVSASGNKNSVHFNGDFDVIAQAQESGGVTGRHLTALTASRYGLAECTDNRNGPNRVVNNTLPAPPDKTVLKEGSKTRAIRAKEVMIKCNKTVPAKRPASMNTNVDGENNVDPLMSSDEEDNY